jgi:hypothetical protein
MSRLDEIMEAIQQAADAMDDCLDGSLRDMIAAALADAERKGAEQMREMCEKAVWLTRLESELPDSDDNGTSGWIEVAEDRVRRSPIPVPASLPTSQRQAVRLADEAALSALPDCHGTSLGKTWLLKTYRAIETAVLAANGLEARRG